MKTASHPLNRTRGLPGWPAAAVRAETRVMSNPYTRAKIDVTVLPELPG